MAKRTKKSGTIEKPNEQDYNVPSPATPIISGFGVLPKLVDIPTVWSDTVVFGINREAALVMLRFFSVMDDFAIEVARVQIPEPLAKDVINRLCIGLNHFPPNPTNSPSPALRANKKRRKRT